MVETGHVLSVEASRGIRDIRYRPRAGRLPVEAFPLAQLRSRVDLDAMGPERLHFHLVLVGLSGSGEHEVDFDRVGVEPLQVLHVLPGQVHRWVRPGAFEAQLVLLPDDPSLRPPGIGVGVRRWTLTPAEWQRCEALLPALAEETQHTQPADRRDEGLLAWRRLLVLRLGLDRALPDGDLVTPDADGAPLPAPYLALRAELEAHLTPVRTVTQIAAALGYAPRTLTRACLAATGRTAKELVDERVYLEARRLLVHTGRPVAAVATELGFSEPTNFTKFFVRMSGGTPGRWRASHSPGAAV